MPKEKKQLTPGGVFIQLKQGAKASEVDEEILESIASKPLFTKKQKGGLNKFMKERSGAAVTKDEADRLKDEMNFKNKSEELKEKYTKSLSGAAISEAEENRLKDVMPDYAEGGEVVVGKGKDYIKDLL